MERITAMPEASAEVSGDNRHPEIKGRIEFYGVYGGTVVVAEVSGLTEAGTGQEQGFYGFHIHEGASCTGKQSDSFANTGGHYNPGNKSHPQHAGDLPPLLSDAGEAWMSVYTSRFFPIGRMIFTHSHREIPVRKLPVERLWQRIREIKKCCRSSLKTTWLTAFFIVLF